MKVCRLFKMRESGIKFGYSSIERIISLARSMSNFSSGYLGAFGSYSFCHFRQSSRSSSPLSGSLSVASVTKKAAIFFRTQTSFIS